ncbi:MAG: hydrolase TatD [Candidatus Pelagibacter sp.]|nr:hydrolase TatD [Candidatus Pelagibacter sp.]|tara:strand:- start:239 stop:1009 length:771 start_codon:yes stop_codon:yes gene_type:complete
MIDSHCHLDHEHLIANLDQVIANSKNVGLEKLLTICTTLQSYEKITNIVKKDPMIFGTFGIHPHETKNNDVSKDEIITKINLNNKIIGVGETGLDFYYNNSDKDLQIKSFQKHIDAAKDLNIPLIIHSRNAEDETYDILKKNHSNKLKILMHCFTGSTEFATKLIPLNAFFSASGIITFKNSLNLQETFKMIPKNRLLIETDSPYLSPVPYRGKKNEPAFIKFTAEKLAELQNIKISELVDITTKNFNKLFFDRLI